MIHNIRVDTKEAEDYLTRLNQDNQLAFAVSKATNNLLKLIQSAIQGDMRARVNLRRVAFNLQGIKVFKWSKKRDLLGILGIDPRLNNLIRLQTGQDHIPLNGRKYISVPNPVVFGNRIILKTNPLKASNLGLHDTPQGIQGNNGTFLVHPKDGSEPIILQRTQKANLKKKGKKGTDKGTGVRLLHFLRRSTKTTKKIDFYGIAYNIINTHLKDELIKACDEAIKSARK